MPSEVDGLAFGDIVLVPFPFTDQSAVKRRPAVVISSAEYNEQQPDVILMPVTSQLRASARPFDVIIEGWELAGLLKPSAVKPIIATLEQAILIRRLGAIEPADRTALTDSLDRILAH